jgi:ferredoxin
MIRSITKSKSFEEIKGLLEGIGRVFIVGCGTCATMCHTGGQSEVQEMKRRLVEELNKVVTGIMIIPVACDGLSQEAVEEHGEAIKGSQALLIMTCAFGVQTVGIYTDLPVIPALDTMFIGKEKRVGVFDEVCTQCGECILAYTAGICPVTACHKGLINGPCGGTNKGKCEVDPEKDCAWTIIYQRLAQQGRLDLMKRYQPPKNYQSEPKPGKAIISPEGKEER